MAKDFINILQEIRGTGTPGAPFTNGIWHELTIADINGNPGIYGDILAKYGIIVDNSSDIQAIANNLTLLNTVSTNMAAITDVASNPVRSALLAVVSEPLRQSILDAEANTTAAATSATDAQLRAWEAQAEKLTANSWANEPTDTFVKTYTSDGDGTFTATTTAAQYSARHYKDKAELITGGGLNNFSRYGVVSGLAASINATNTLFDLSAGEYYINDTIYEYTGSTGNATGLTAGESLLVIGMNASGLVTKKTTFTDTELLSTIEIAALLTQGGATQIVAIGDSKFLTKNSLARLNARIKNYEETKFDKTAALISINAANPLRLDIASGYLNDAEMDSKFVTAATQIGGVYIKHVAGNWNNTIEAVLTVDTNNYDNGTELVPATVGRYLAYSVHRSSRTGTVYLVAPQGEYGSFSEALVSPCSGGGLADIVGIDVVKIARLICKVGDARIRYVKDARDVISKFSPRVALTDGTKNLSSIGNGSIIETITTAVVSNGTTVTLTYADPANSHLTCQFDEQSFLLANGSTVLTHGSDTAPTRNFVYVELVAGVATVAVSTNNFPAGQHCPIAEVLVQSPTSVQADGPYAFQAWIDHMQGPSGLGHLHHINYWLRQQRATHLSGMVTTTSPIVGESALTLDASVTAGEMLQLHKYISDALSVSVSEAYIINHPTTPYLKVNNLNMLVDSANGSLSGRVYSLVLLVTVNEDGTKLYINLPSGSYTSVGTAIVDDQKRSVYTIPAGLSGKTVLAARITVSHSVAGGGTWTVRDVEDLTQLQSTGGGSVGAIKNVFTDNEFKITDEVDPTKIARFESGGIATGTERTITIPDKNGELVLTNGAIMTGAITALRETKVAMGANDIDLSAGNVFTKTISEATTLTVSNVLASGNANSFILELTNGGAFALTWFSGVKWASGTVPTLTASGVDILGFYSHDGGTTYRAVILAKDSK